jgi:phage host-nuclease inhibitor protein Gam
MATRTKTAAISIYPDWGGVDAALGKARELTAKRDKLNAEAAKKLAAIQEKQVEQVGPLDAELAQIGTNINLFTDAHRDELDNKSRKLTNGRVYIRLAPPALKTLKDWTWKRVVEALQARNLKKFLREKAPEVDKEALKTSDLSEGQLEDLGVQIAQDEEIGYELTDTDAKPTV